MGANTRRTLPVRDRWEGDGFTGVTYSNSVSAAVIL